ncbi:MAG TPA: YlzJ-like family protein [Negativicutes bacterium]|jgi:hypothetical protein
MILWTVMPLEAVMGNVDNAAPPYEEMQYAGMKIVIEKIDSAQCRIVRLMTTDPQDYLRPELQPGTVLTYKPVFEALS